MAPHGIRGNAVAPVFMATDMVADAWRKKPTPFLERIPLRHIADPVEVANAILFLASDKSSDMTGTTMC